MEAPRERKLRGGLDGLSHEWHPTKCFRTFAPPCTLPMAHTLNTNTLSARARPKCVPGTRLRPSAEAVTLGCSWAGAGAATAVVSAWAAWGWAAAAADHRTEAVRPHRAEGRQQRAAAARAAAAIACASPAWLVAAARAAVAAWTPRPCCSIAGAQSGRTRTIATRTPAAAAAAAAAAADARTA
jgi:hypothetical protein